MKFTAYILICGEDNLQLSGLVTKALKEGFIPYGEPIIHDGAGYFQAVVMPIVEAKPE